MLVILLNCVTLGMFQPCEDISCLSDWCRILQVSGLICTFTRAHLCFTAVFFLACEGVGEFSLSLPTALHSLHCLKVAINPFLK